MLVYVQQNKISDVLCPVLERDIPRHLRTRFENEKQEEMARRHEREQATLYCDVTLVTDDNLADHHGFDIGDYDAIKGGRSGNTIRIPKTSNVRDFYNKVAEALNLPTDGIRLWKYDVVYGKDDGFTPSLESHRPRSWIYCQPDDSIVNAAALEPKGDNIFYVETGKPKRGAQIVAIEAPTQLQLGLSPYDRESSILAFIKLYEPGRKKFNYVGSIVFSLDDTLTKYHPEISQMVGLPRDAKLNLYLVSFKM
jgi:ubiquitin carboxyl-terminal hydrolase 7